MALEDCVSHGQARSYHEWRVIIDRDARPWAYCIHCLQEVAYDDEGRMEVREQAQRTNRGR